MGVVSQCIDLEQPEQVGPGLSSMSPDQGAVRAGFATSWRPVSRP